jgi:hypothetical protein
MTQPEPKPNRLADAVVLVTHGRSFAFGLRWTSATSRATLVQEAQAAAATEGASYVAVHPAYNQFGLACISPPPRGLARWLFQPRSGASSIALAVGTAALAAFPLEDGRWLVLAFDRKGILPDGDLILENEVAAQERVTVLLDQSPAVWRKRFVPEHWGIPDSRSVHPTELLVKSRAPRLKPIFLLANRGWLRIGLVASALTLVALGAGILRVSSETVPTLLAPTPPAKPTAAKWTPAPFSIDQCLFELAVAEKFRAVAGWVPTKFTCLAGTSLFIDFSRSGNGQISTLLDMLPPAQIADDGHTATLTLPLEPLPQISSLGPFDLQTRYRRTVLDLGQRLNGTFSIQPARKLLPGESAASVPSPWAQFAWSYRTAAPPAVWAGALSQFGAFDIESLSHTPGDKLWLISGSLYAQP